ncbi:MAG: hypothetical protein ACFE8B_03925 [Candidatus Hermodarchaeota archaeon]
MKFSHFSLHNVTYVQFTLAIMISLIFQFFFPLSWQPLDTFLYGSRNHGDPGTNIIIFTISQWYFSFSIAWLIYRENPIINNFLIYSIVPLGIIVVYEFSVLFLYYDYIHITPLIIDIFLIWRKRETLSQKLAPYIIALNITWLILVYFFELAYYDEELIIFMRNIFVYFVLWSTLSFFFKTKKEAD